MDDEKKITYQSTTLGVPPLKMVLVHAKNDSVARYYAKYGFEPSPINPLVLMLILKDIKHMLHGDKP